MYRVVSVCISVSEKRGYCDGRDMLSRRIMESGMESDNCVRASNRNNGRMIIVVS